MVINAYRTNNFVNGAQSFWIHQHGHPEHRAYLPGNVDADVAVVGGGMTGLWSAYYLKKADPSLDIVVIEREFAGWGASGRNGGWLSAKSPGQFRHYAKFGGRDAAVRLEREMFSAVAESVSVAEREGFATSIDYDGMLFVATNDPQSYRLQAEYQALRNQGWSADDCVLLSAGELSDRVRIAGARQAYWSPHCARINPADFAFGLARAVERLGVTIYERTTATSIESHVVKTDRGDVRAKFVVQALEGYTDSLRGQKRRMLPMNSSMVVTESLSDSIKQDIGWDKAELIGDMAHSFSYIQRTADGRIAIGGRGVPYNFSSSFDRDGRTAEKAVEQLRLRLVELFPVLGSTKLEHTWSGVLGVPRNWSAGIQVDRAAGLICAGGYVGHGVTGTNLAGRTVRDLILGEATDLTTLPWVGFTARRWEPEPLRWLGATALYAGYRFADRLEYRSNQSRTNVVARVANLISGRY